MIKDKIEQVLEVLSDQSSDSFNSLSKSISLNQNEKNQNSSQVAKSIEVS